MFFANEQRENVREENPGISFGEIPHSRPALALTRADCCVQQRPSWQGSRREMEGLEREAANPI